MFSTPFVLAFTLILSLPLIFLLAPRFLPPKPLQISLSDELDDLSLFRRATLASFRPFSSSSAVSSAVSSAFLRLGSSNPNPKIAFLFLINSHLHFSPLWEVFFRNNHHLFNIYVHPDPSIKIPLTGVFSGRAVPAKPTERASPTLISAERRLLAAALLDDPLNLYFALLSPSCIPLHSFPFVYRSLFLSPRPHQSFIEILAQEPTLASRYDARGEGVMLPEVAFEEFRVGSQFFVMNRKHALMVIRDRKLWRKFRLPCINMDTCYPEEHYFPTLLSMQDPKGCSHYTLTRVNWTDSTDGHPHTYQPSEISPELIFRLRESNSSYDYLFARKFSPDCLKPLMDISESVIFQD